MAAKLWLIVCVHDCGGKIMAGRGWSWVLVNISTEILVASTFEVKALSMSYGLPVLLIHFDFFG